MFRLFTIVACLVFPLFLGCGQGAKFGTDYVEGIVTLDGVPLADASVSFSPKDAGMGKFANGRTDSSGHYTLTAQQGGGQGKGTTPGEYIVLVTKFEQVKLDTPRKNLGGGPPITTETVNKLPKAYNDVNAAKLTATVAAGKNKLDFDLKSNEK